MHMAKEQKVAQNQRPADGPSRKEMHFPLRGLRALACPARWWFMDGVTNDLTANINQQKLANIEFGG